MRQDVREWLPTGAFEADDVRSAIADVVDQWSRRWFAAAPLAVAKLAFTPGGLPQDSDGAWTIHHQAVAVRLSRMMTGRLLERALDISFDGLVLSEVDRRVLVVFTQNVVADLAASLERLIGDVGERRSPPATIADPFDAFGGVVVHLTDGRDPLLSLAVPFQAMVKLCKSRLTAPRRRGKAPARIAAALAPTHVTIEATLGRARMSLADLRGLAPGDVVVLDAALEDGGEIALVNSNKAIARAKLSQVDGCLALTLQAKSH